MIFITVLKQDSLYVDYLKLFDLWFPHVCRVFNPRKVVVYTTDALSTELRIKYCDRNNLETRPLVEPESNALVNKALAVRDYVSYTYSAECLVLCDLDIVFNKPSVIDEVCEDKLFEIAVAYRSTYGTPDGRFLNTGFVVFQSVDLLRESGSKFLDAWVEASKQTQCDEKGLMQLVISQLKRPFTNEDIFRTHAIKGTLLRLLPVEYNTKHASFTEKCEAPVVHFSGNKEKKMKIVEKYHANFFV